MKRFKAQQIYLLFILILSSFIISGCGGGDVTGHWLPGNQLMFIKVTPVAASIPMGAPQQFTAVATYSNGTSFDVTATSAWTSGTPSVATVNATTGLARGVAIGTSVVTAAYGGLAGSATLAVTAATLTSIAVTPATASVPVGLKRTFVATGAYSDGTSVNISNVVTWTSGTPAVATVVSPGVATGVSVGAATITATLGAISGSATLTVTAATLTSIVVTPLTASVPIGLTRTFVATGAYSDGTSVNISNIVTWTSGTPAVATVVSPGVATGQSVGIVMITASLGAVSGSATLTVTAATLTSIAVTPLTASVPKGLTRTFVATGTYSDATSVNISNIVTWTSGNITVATILSPGIATGQSVGTAAITATLGAISGSATLTVTPATLTSIAVTPAAASVPMGLTRTFVANGTYSDASIVNISNIVTWTSGAIAVATVASPGVATGLSVGAATITATQGAVSGSATLTVTAATLTSIAVTPLTASVVIGGIRIFVANGTYSDLSVVNISNIVTWTSGSIAVATVVSPGAATGVSVGTATITATLGAAFGSATLTVTAIPPGSCGAGILPLGSATNFGVLAGTALSITNPTSVTGDVGSPSITPASGPSTLVGTQYDTSTGSLTLIATAVDDMETATGCAAGRACDFSYAAAHDFGGDVLLPGVHCVTGAMSVGSNLTLTTPGVYIFRATGGLTSANNITVAFAGLANATNTTVFWVPTGSASIGSGNTFLGTIMPGASAAITLGANTTLLPGRALSSAAVTLSTNTISIP